MGKYNKKQIGVRIASIRVEAGFSQADLSIDSGFSEANISRWENGKNVMGLINAAILADVLNCSLDDFLGR